MHRPGGLTSTRLTHAVRTTAEASRELDGEADRRGGWDGRSDDSDAPGRSLVEEELPLSTRVHELAKELGLKSQELLERIQKWGLDVKLSALASLDPSAV